MAKHKKGRSMSDALLYHNGQWSEDGALFAFSDRLRLGDGIFDTMLVIIENGIAKLIHPQRHFERLLHDAQLLEITPLLSIDEFIKTAQTLFEKNSFTDGRYALNTLITRGIGERGLMPPQEMNPSITMRAAPAPTISPAINAITARRTFRNDASPLSQVKSCNYGDNILVLIEARNKGANEAIMFNTRDKVACATSGNIFVILDGVLYTPPLSDGVMNGITRSIFMEKFDVIECSLEIKDLQKAEGIYITNSIRGVQPITTLNGRKLPAPSIQIEQDIHLA